MPRQSTRLRELSPALRSAIEVAEERIARVNRRQVPNDEVIELEPGALRG